MITVRSLAIIRLIAAYRFLPTSLLLPLVGGDPRTTADHLYHLYHRAVINRFQITRNGEFVYFLDNRDALALLAASGFTASEELRESVRNNREKDYASAVRNHDPGKLMFVEHELMISRFHAALALACAHSGSKVELVSFKQGSVLYNRVKAPKLSQDGMQELHGQNQMQFLPHRPDAAFVLRSGESTRAFLYEADRQTTAAPRFREKLRSYFHFVIKQRLAERFYGLPVRAVLVETLDSHWAETLREAACHPVVAGGKPSALFWFAPSSTFARPVEVRTGTRSRQVPLFLTNPSAVFTPIWATPASDTLRSLLED